VIEHRPFLYHLISRQNLSRILDTRSLVPAADLLRAAGHEELIRQRRPKDLELVIGSDRVILRNQKPLVEANLLLEDGWIFADLIEYLNELVFFWPGTPSGLDPLGTNFLTRYSVDTAAILRVRLASAARANPVVRPLFSKYNTGAGRFSAGKPSPRGPTTFVVAGHTDSIGSDAYNQDLSERRADTIKRYLTAKYGINGTDLVTVGYGESKPKDPNAPMDPINRRVQVVNMDTKTASK
jgi:hypothetical protein